MIPHLPEQLLKAQHRDCCALRGRAWGKGKSSKLRWLWNYTQASIEFYHLLVLDEMEKRGWKPSPQWRVSGYRGKKARAIPPAWQVVPSDWPNSIIFKEHNQAYFIRDLQFLRKWMATHSVSDRDCERISALI